MIHVKAEDVILQEVDADEFWVDISAIDSEIVPVEKCSCGQKFEFFEFHIHNNDLDSDKFVVDQCPHCHQEFIAVIKIKIYQVQHG